jgi:hypothetical protein
MNDERCEACKFYVALRPLQGECHERSPRVFQLVIPVRPSPLTPGGQPSNGSVEVHYAGAWPPVNKDKWCGKFEPRLKA